MLVVFRSLPAAHGPQLPLDCVRKPEFWPDYHPSSQEASSHVPKQGTDYPANTLLDVGGERVVLGKPAGFPSFGWDNEYGVKVIEVREASLRLRTALAPMHGI
jgi:hypothetical protein